MRLLENPEKRFLVNACKICRILAINLASSATAERTFFLARRVKTWMRSTMLPTRFNPSPFSISTKIGEINLKQDRPYQSCQRICSIGWQQNAKIWKIYKERLIITISHSLGFIFFAFILVLVIFENIIFWLHYIYVSLFLQILILWKL